MRWLARTVRSLAVAVVASAAVALPALAQFDVPDSPPVYYRNNCSLSGCHFVTPPKINADGRTGQQMFVAAARGTASDYLRSAIAFRDHLIALNAAAEMNNLAGADSGDLNSASSNINVIRNYLRAVRDGGATGSTTINFASTNIGATRTAFVTLYNYRFVASGFSITKSGSNITDFAVSGCSLNGSDTGGVVPGSASNNPPPANFAIPVPGSCTLTFTFQPLQSADTSRGAAVFTINYAGNVEIDPVNVPVTLSGSVPAPALSFTPGATTASARVDLGQSADVNIGTVANSGQATLNVAIAAATANPAGGTYTQIFPAGSCSTSQNLAAGASCNVVIRFTPSQPVTSQRTFSITPSVGSAINRMLSGTGTRPLISPTSPPNLAIDLGTSQLGVPTSLPVSQLVTNSGNAPLAFTVSPTSNAAKSGANPGDFAVVLVCPSGQPIPAGANCRLDITFTPGGLGARSATLTISSDATNGPLIIDLIGNGSALPEPAVTPTVPDFPDTVINENSAQNRTFTITNTRVRDVTYAVTSSNPDFVVLSESCAPSRVVAGNNTTPCNVTVRFRPLAAGGETRRTGNLTFTFTGTPPDANPGSIVRAVAGNALLPLQQSATSINAAAVVGSPMNSSVILTNRASTPITLLTFVFSGAFPGDYSLAPSNTCTPALALAPSTSCTLVVRFDPATAGTRNATLTITHGAAGSPQTVQYLGTATPAPQGRIELSAAALTFADTQLASTSAQTVTVRNSGDLALNFSAFTSAGANPGDYTRGGTCNVGTPVPIAGECTVVVHFGPTALGLRTASLSIASDASNGTAVLSLSGTGVPIPVPVVSLAPALLDFGTQTIGGLFPARRVRLANVGTADLLVSSIAISGAGFGNVSAAACPTTLVPGAGCDIDIAFTAAAAIAYTGSVTVTDNAAGSPHTAALRGQGSAAAVPVVVYAPVVTTLAFGSVSAGSLSTVQTATIQNQGPGGVSLTLLNAVGPDAASFAVVGGTCAIGAVIFEGQTCTIDIRFAPGSAGTKTAQLQIASTGSFPPVLTLAGTGLAGPNPSFALSEAALAFASTRVGAESLPATLRLSASGSGVVTVTAMDVTGPWVVSSTTCPSMPFTLAAGTDCTVAVAFKPIDEGSAAGTLRITTDAAPAQRDVALAGNGEGERDVSDGGAGGCTMGDGTSPFDPTLWALLLAALAVLAHRGAAAAARRRRSAVRRARDGQEGSL